MVYLHLQYAILAWGKTRIYKLQKKQNYIVKIISNEIARKTKLEPLYDELCE